MPSRANSAFPGGSLLFSPTPAMLLIDIDGTSARARTRACRGACAGRRLAPLRRRRRGRHRFPDFAGQGRSQAGRRGASTPRWANGRIAERTAMNGFGLVQLVARLQRPSLLQLATYRRAGAAWRMLLRRAELLEGAGQIELTINPALRAEADADSFAELRAPHRPPGAVARRSRPCHRGAPRPTRAAL